MYKIIGADQTEYGPVPAAELRRWVAEGRADAQTLVWAEGMPAWCLLSALPEFAAALPASAPASSRPVTNGLAVAGFILSLLGFFCFVIGLPFSLIGLLFSLIGLLQIGRDERQGGRGIAIAGVIISILGFFVSIGLFMAWVTAMLAEAA